MHIPENYLSPSTCAVMTLAMAPVWWMAVKKVKEEIPREKLPLIGVAAAFSFLGMMFNIPMPGGTTGHAVGGTLIAILFGPYAACLAVSVALFIQAFFFGDGGILAFGANCFNMAFLLPFGGYFIYKFLKDKVGETAAAGFGSYVGINLAALFAAVEFGIQPLLFTDAMGHALYCPYPLSVSVPAMMLGHLTIFGAAEVIFTVLVLSFIRNAAPSMIQVREGNADGNGIKAVYGLVAALIVLTPLGLLAEGTAWGEWAPEELAGQTFLGGALGYTPLGMENGFSFDAFFPDYTVGGMPETFAYVLSAVIGVALLVIIFKIFATLLSKNTAQNA